jgi:hypothetical protein
VDPWAAQLRQDDEIEWVLSADAASDSIAIVAKRGQWPFAQSPPYRGSKGQPPRGREMRPKQDGRRVRYAIQLVCGRDGGAADTVVIDPDIIIRPK